MEPTAEQLAELGMTAEQFAELAPSEQEAVLTDSSESDRMTLGQAEAADAANKAADERGEPPAPEAGAAPTAGDAGDGAQDPAAAGEEAGDEPPPPPVTLNQQDVEAKQAAIAAARQKAEADRTEIEGKYDALDQQLESGDITSVEYNRQKRTLDKQILDVVRAEARADAAEESLKDSVASAQAAYRAAMQNRWVEAQRDFFADEPNAPIYRSKELGVNARKHFEQQARMLASLPENADKSMQWFLREADLRVRGILSIKTADPLRVPGKAGEPARKPRSPDLSSVPPSLGTLPPAGRDTPQGKYAEIDKLTGEAYLAALDRMSDAERDEYLATQ